MLFRRPIALLALATLSSISLVAQSVNATLRGNVRDSSGASIAGAVVRVVNTEKGIEREVKTNEQGDYVVGQLPAQTYSITVSAVDFKTVVNESYVLQVNQEARYDVELPVGNLAQQVQVSTAPPLIQSENGLNGGVIDQQKIKELPINSRNFWQLAQLNPNVSAPTTGSSLLTRGGFVVAGVGEANNNYLLDGADDNDWTTGQPTVRPSQDAIREFRLISGTAPAEFGRRAGGQIQLTTKSGGNNLHGTAFFFYRNGVLNARNFFTSGAQPDSQSRQFGGSIGGPIKKDKTFFFGTYEGTFLTSDPGIALTFPYAAQLSAVQTGDFRYLSSYNAADSTTWLKDPANPGQRFTNNQVPISRFTDQSKLLLGYFPQPENTATSNNYTNNIPNDSKNSQVTFRIDQVLSQKQTIGGIYTVLTGKDTGTSGDFVATTNSPNFGTVGPHTYQHASFTDDYIFTPNIYNEFRGGFNRMDAGYTNQDQKYGNVDGQLGLPQGAGGLQPATNGNLGVPLISIAGLSTIGSGNNPQWRGDNTIHLADGLTWVKGAHTFKFGVDYLNFFKHSFFVSNGRGQFTFNNTTYSGNAWADFLLGYIATDSYGNGNTQQYPRQRAVAAYVQDDWKISPSLTINYGLRYEHFQPNTEGYNRISKFDAAANTILTGPGAVLSLDNSTGTIQQIGTAAGFKTLFDSNYLNFAPRFGFAYRVGGKADTVIRGGYGVYYNLMAIQTWNSSTGLGAPYLLSKAYTGSSSAPLTWSSPFAATTPVGGIAISTIDPKIPRPYTQQWSFGIQRQLGRNALVEVSYQGSKSTHYPNTYALNNPTLATRRANPAASIQSLRPYNNIGTQSAWGGISVQKAGYSGSYNSFMVRGEKRYSNGLNFNSFLVYAKSLDLNSTPQDPANPQADWGPSDYDQKLRSITTAIYDLPFGKGRHWLNEGSPVVRGIVGGWRATVILALQSGRPFNVTTTDTIASNTGATDRAFIVPGQSPTASRTSAGVKTRTVSKWFNTDAFRANDPANASTSTTTVFNFGSAGRNSLRGPGLQNLDFGLFRELGLGEGRTLQVRAEAFNIMNHPNFANPSADYSSPATLGVISTTVGSSLSTATGANRQLQFGAKFVF